MYGINSSSGFPDPIQQFPDSNTKASNIDEQIKLLEEMLKSPLLKPGSEKYVEIYSLLLKLQSEKSENGLPNQLDQLERPRESTEELIERLKDIKRDLEDTKKDLPKPFNFT